MINPPKTREEAEKYRYNIWGGNPKGSRFNKTKCAYELMDNWLLRQCRRNSGYGPDGLYCKQHAKEVEGQ
jgi:hypothetical protein